MTSERALSALELRHALNNLMTKIMGAADLALVERCEPQVRSELETIIALAQEGSALIKDWRGEPPGD